MNLLQDIITYVRRIIKSPSNAVITDNLIIDYINRFWLMDVDARIQLFDLKTQYQFQTTPGFDRYNMPLYGLQVEGSNPTSSISYYPVYQGFTGPASINGIQVPLQTEKQLFFNMYPNVVQNFTNVSVGDGTPGPYTFNIPIGTSLTTPINLPLQYILRGHVDMTGQIYAGGNVGVPIQSTTLNQNIPYTSIFPAVYITTMLQDGRSVVVQDSGQFLNTDLSQGLLMFGTFPVPGTTITTPTSPYVIPTNGYSNGVNTINYLTGEVNITFAVSIPLGTNINVQCYLFQTGLPRQILFYNNTLTLRSPPDRQYLVELDAYLSPAAYLQSSNAIQFAYMSEYIARGAARKILTDTGDIEQFQFYEPLFREQEILVWKRSQRQFTATRTQTIYSNSGFINNYNQSSIGI